MTSKTRTLLASDLDGTLVPPRPTVRRRADIDKLSRAIEAAPNLELAYVTGRHLSSALEAVRALHLPEPRFMVTDVGTTLYELKRGRWVQNRAYRTNMLARLGGLERRKVDTAIRAAADLDTLLVRQAKERQAPFKWSFYAPPGIDGKGIAGALGRRLTRRGVKATVVWSVDPVDRRGLVDVLPRGAGKDSAVAFLAGLTGAKSIVFAGDSGNDLAVFESGICSVVVGNAGGDVRTALAKALARRRSLSRSVYFAKGTYAAGVLEGCLHFGILAVPSAARKSHTR